MESFVAFIANLIAMVLVITVLVWYIRLLSRRVHKGEQYVKDKSFASVVEHLSKRGVATRRGWNGAGAVYFGMDNALWFVHIRMNNGLSGWLPSLKDFSENDWIKIKLFWDNQKDFDEVLKTKLEKAMEKENC